MRHSIHRKLSKELSRKKGKKIVSFDIFDTALLRIVCSEDVSLLSAKTLSALALSNTGIEISPKKISDSRKVFQKHKESISMEWTVSEWLKDSAKDFGVDPMAFCELGRKSEIEAEISGLEANPEIEYVFRKLRNDHIEKIIAISDTWHDEEDLNTILNHFGIYFDAVYTSGTRKSSKADRAIFDIVQKEHPGFDFFHIGDNLVSDFVNPRIQGWKSIWVPRTHPMLPVWIPKPLWKGPLKPKPEDSIARILTNGKNASRDDLYQLGYFFLAPVLILFSLIQWKYFRENRVEIVFFIARDGKIPFEAYKKISPLFPESHSIFYCRLSRKSVLLFHPARLFEKALPIPGKFGRKTMGEWIDNFEIDEDLKTILLSEAGVAESSKFDYAARNKLVRIFEKHEDEIQKQIHVRADMARDYLAALAGGKLERVGFVDSGWAATIQDCLRNALSETQVVCGAYLGVGSQGERPFRFSKKYGMLRDDFRKCPHHNPVDASAGAIRVWESLLTEPVGSVARLERQNCEVKPVLRSPVDIGPREKKIYSTIQKSVSARIDDSQREIKRLVDFLDIWSFEDLEKAASLFSRHITVAPSRKVSAAIIGRKFEEGAAGAKSSSLGLRGIRTGTAWYPGIVAMLAGSYSARLFSCPMRLAAKILCRMKKERADSRYA